MKFIVTCPECPPYAGSSEFPNKPSAEAFVRRHHIVGEKHRATITRINETPLEGLL